MKQSFLFISLLIAYPVAKAQSWLITGNSGITNSNFLGTTDARDLFFKTNNKQYGRLTSGGNWRFGNTTSYLRIDSLGRLSFIGSGVYQVNNNAYAFQWIGNANIGLFFSASNSRYEFRNSVGGQAFYCTSSGVGYFSSKLSLGTTLVPGGVILANGIIESSMGGFKFPDATTQTTAFSPYTAGSGINIAGTIISNTSPDQAVNITGGGISSVTGSYPNFTITSNEIDPQVSAVTTNKISKWNGITLVDGIIYDDGTNVGINNTSPIGGLDIVNNNGLVAKGSFGSGNIPSTGGGIRMMWYPKKAAFRVGQVSSSEWDDSNIGDYSFASGFSSIAKGENSTAMGINTYAPGFGATAMGNVSRATGNYSFAIGYDCEATGNESLAMLRNASASGVRSAAIGYFINARSGYETVIGSWNTDYVPNSTIDWDPNDRLFVVGNGTSVLTSDAMVILKSGKTGIGISSPSHLLQLGTDDAAKPATSTWMVVSDQRLKTNVHAFEDGWNVLKDLNPVWFTYNGKGGTQVGENAIGTLAQDLQKVAPYMVSTWNCKNMDGTSTEYLGVNYHAMFFLLANTIKELHKKMEIENIQLEDLQKQTSSRELIISFQKNQISEQQKLLMEINSELATLKLSVARLESSYSQCCSSIQLSDQSLIKDSLKNNSVDVGQVAILEQNVPNPWTQTSYIRFFIPSSAKEAIILLNDVNGKQVKQFTDLPVGFGGITIEPGTLNAGTYFYALMIDGKLIDRKKMELLK